MLFIYSIISSEKQNNGGGGRAIIFSMLEVALCQQALQWRAAGQQVAAAVVLSTWGSAPRPVGARLFVRADGEFIGSVSGGCIEGEVITAAAEVLADGKAQRLAFGVADETAWEAGLSCGGEITVLVHPLDDNAAACLTGAIERLAARRESILCTSTVAAADGTRCRLLDENDAIISGTAGAEDESNAVFTEALPPPPRLLIVGATHITQHLVEMAQRLDFACVVIDPRRRWASAARFPDVAVLALWADEALMQLAPGAQDAVITLTHDPKIDDPALTAALTTQPPPFYIGALGSRRTHAKRLERLQLAETEAARIHAPVGLPLGATTAAEIALSVMAEVVQVYRARLPKDAVDAAGRTS